MLKNKNEDVRKTQIIVNHKSSKFFLEFSVYW